MHRLSTAALVCAYLSVASYGCQPVSSEEVPTGGSGQQSHSTTQTTGGSAGASATGGSDGSAKGGSGDGGRSTARGGASGAGSSVSTGGWAGGAGQGGASSGGGSSGKGGGAGGGASGQGGTGGASTVACSFTQGSSTSSKIPTVGIVTWSTTLADLKSAKIDFGLTTAYGFVAPVDLSQKDHRTLLLGMKQSRTYHYRITATGNGGDCTSPDYTITTGTLPNGLPQIDVSTKNASSLYGGFFLTGQYLSLSGGRGSPAYIIDADVDFVWAYVISSNLSCVQMDNAGTHIWLNSANVPEGGPTTVHRVTLDGLSDEDLSSKLAGLNHQLTILPDETVAFYAYSSNGCDDIKEYTPATGAVRTVVNSGTAQAGARGCHVNDIQYSKDDDTLVFSDLSNQTVVKVRRSDGSMVWILNGKTATYTGDGWKGSQHGIHMLGRDRFVLFNNNSVVLAGSAGLAGGDGAGSIAMEFSLDLSAKKITRIWDYKADPGLNNIIMGDLQRLPNGNTLVGYSTQGVLHEVSSNGTLLQALTWKNTTQFGYFEKRASLYGPRPR